MGKTAVTVSKISSKGQITLPAEIRHKLALRPGDAVKYTVEKDAVRLTKADTLDLHWAASIESTLTEWSGPEDDDL